MRGLKLSLSIPNASGINSMNDIYIITPAENPNAAERNFVLVRLAKNAMRLPTPVDRPAIIVRRNAKSIEFISIFSRLYKTVKGNRTILLSGNWPFPSWFFGNKGNVLKHYEVHRIIKITKKNEIC